MNEKVIELEVLLKMLEEAYDAGWHGTKEMKGEAAQQILDKNKDSMRDSFTLCSPNYLQFVSTYNAPSSISLDFDINRNHGFAANFNNTNVVVSST